MVESEKGWLTFNELVDHIAHESAAGQQALAWIESNEIQEGDAFTIKNSSDPLHGEAFVCENVKLNVKFQGSKRAIPSVVEFRVHATDYPDLVPDGQAFEMYGEDERKCVRTNKTRDALRSTEGMAFAIKEITRASSEGNLRLTGYRSGSDQREDIPDTVLVDPSIDPLEGCIRSAKALSPNSEKWAGICCPTSQAFEMWPRSKSVATNQESPAHTAAKKRKGGRKPGAYHRPLRKYLELLQTKKPQLLEFATLKYLCDDARNYLVRHNARDIPKSRSGLEEPIKRIRAEILRS